MQSWFPLLAARLIVTLLVFCGGLCLTPMCYADGPGSKLPKEVPFHQVLPSVPQVLSGALWRVDHTFQSEIRMKNIVQNASVTVRPVLFMADGTRYELSSVKIAPSGIAVINVNDALDRAPSEIRNHVSSFGSAELDYVFGWQALTASIAALDPVRSLSYNTPFSAPPAASAASSRQKHGNGAGHGESAGSIRDVEGLWWKRDDNVGAFIFLSNVSTVHTDAVVDLLSNSRQVLSTEHASLNPHESRLISFDDKLVANRSVGQAGGVSIRYLSNSNLAIAGGLENSAEGFSASIPFTVEFPSDTQPPARTVASVGIMNGTPGPMMMFPADVTFAPYAVLRNPNSHLVAVTPTVYYPSGSTWLPLQLPSISLDAGEARMLDLAGALNGTPAQTAPDLHLTFTGPADLLVATGSVDQTGTFVFEVQPDIVSQSAGKSLCYWKFSDTDGTDTMVTLWNHSNVAQDIVFTLLFASGQYAVPVHLEPKATDMFNISDLIMSGTADASGHTIPMNLTEGSASITGSRGELDPIDVTVDAALFNVHTATCSSLCKNCQGYTGAWTNPTSETLGVGATGQLQAIGQWQTGSQFDLTGKMTWSSKNSSVASVSATALVTGMSSGSTTIDGEAFVQTSGTACGQLDANGDPILTCPIIEPISVAPPANVVSVAITTADITQDLITVLLTGPAGTSGNLRLEVSGDSGNPIQPINTGAAPLGPGTHNFNFQQDTIPIGEYTVVKATWTVSGSDFSANVSRHFKVLGTFTQTQYNTPAESTCTGSPIPITVWNANCVGTKTTVISGFDFRVTDPTTGTGSGHSLHFGDVLEEFTCSQGRGDLRGFATIKGTLGPVNNSTVAACKSNPDLSVAGAQVYIRGEGVKTVTDSCPACCKDGTHLDNYTTDTRCSGVPSLPSALTVRLF